MRYFLLFLPWCLVSSVQAECMGDSGRIETVCGAGPCVKDRYGEVYCAPHIDGTATLDRYRLAVCSVGRCVTNINDEVICSREPGGDAMRNIYGEVDCYGGCVVASAEACEREFTGPLDEEGNLIRQPGQPPTGLDGYRPPGRPTR